MRQKQEAEFLLNGGLDVSTSVEIQTVESLRLVDDVRMGDDGEWVKRPKTASSQAIVNPANAGVYAGLGGGGLIESRGKVYAATDNYGVMTAGGVYVSSGGGLVTLDPVKYAQHSAPRLARVARMTVDNVSGHTQGQGYHSAAACTVAGGTVLVIASIVYTADGSTQAGITFKAVDIETGAVICGLQYEAPVSGPLYYWVDACEHFDATEPGAVITFARGNGGPYNLYKFRYVTADKRFISDGIIKTDLSLPSHRIKTSNTPGQFILAYGKYPTDYLYAEEANAVSYSVVSSHAGTHGATGGLDVVVNGARTCLISSDQAGGSTIYAENFGYPADAVTLFTSAATTNTTAITAARQTADGEDGIAAVFVELYYSPGSPAPNRFLLQTTHVDFSGNPCVVAGTVSDEYPNVKLAGYAVTIDGRAYAPTLAAGYDVEPFTSCCWVRYEQHDALSVGVCRPIARFAHDAYLERLQVPKPMLSSFAVENHLCCLVPIGSSADDMPGPSGKVPQALALSRSDITPAPATFAKSEGVALVATGLPFDMDAAYSSIAQPFARPIIVVDITGSGGSSAANGVSYVAVYRWVDSAGRLHRSAPSVAVSTGPFSSKQVDVYVTRLPYAPFDTSIRTYAVDLYATENGGSTYYHVNASGYVDLPDSDNLTDHVFADVAAGNPSDPQLYSSGAGAEELTSDPLPPMHAIATVGDRMFAIDAEDRSRIWFTKPMVSGFAPEWNTANTLFLGAQAVGISDVAGIPTVFARDGIYQVFGEGPNALGAGGFAPARKLPHATECLDALSVCKTPSGVLFRARHGIVMLANDGTLVPVGTSIDRALMVSGPANGYCKIAYDELSNEAHVLDFDGSHYVLSLRSGKWSKWTQDPSFQNWADCVFVNGQGFVLHTGGATDSVLRLASQDEDEHNSHTHGRKIRTPWIGFDGPSGDVRIWEVIVQVRTGSAANGSTFGGSLVVTYETRSGTSETFTWTPDEIYAEAGGATEQTINLRCRVTSQRVRQFRLTVEEQTAVYAYSGHVVVSARVHYGVKPGGDRKRTQVQNRGA